MPMFRKSHTCANTCTARYWKLGEWPWIRATLVTSWQVYTLGYCKMIPLIWPTGWPATLCYYQTQTSGSICNHGNHSGLVCGMSYSAEGSLRDIAAVATWNMICHFAPQTSPLWNWIKSGYQGYRWSHWFVSGSSTVWLVNQWAM